MQLASKSVDTDTLSQEELLSAWMDGEAADDVLAGLASEKGRQTWDTYHLIGDTLRNADLAITPSATFRARLAHALEAELPIVAPSGRRSPLRKGISGLVAAVAVVTVLWLAQPYIAEGPGAGSQTDLLADNTTPASFEDSGLHDYLEAHQQMAGQSIVRQISFDLGADH
jgi:sigma-E factor negative regulatory protein RseA